jgi:cytochrome b involved in lipid metabolism
MLRSHNRPDDAWSVFGGKVYNITPYLPFHPGGKKELMRVAGRDGSKLFGKPGSNGLEPMGALTIRPVCSEYP